MAGLALRGKPFGTVFRDVAEPPQRFDIVVERRPSEQADLGDIRRTVARKAALALDAFKHRAFFAADIGAGSSPQFDEARLYQACPLKSRYLRVQYPQDRGIFVAHVEINAFRVDRVRGDQRALERAVRIFFEIDAILECARLTLV